MKHMNSIGCTTAIDLFQNSAIGLSQSLKTQCRIHLERSVYLVSGFGMQKILYLAHIIRKAGIPVMMDPKKV